MLRNRPPRGFTFYELSLILVVLTVVLMVATSSAFQGQIGDNARAQSLWEVASRLAQGWKYVTMQCGTTDRTENNPIMRVMGGATTRSNPIEALYHGPDPAEPANLHIEEQYRGCWRASGVKPFKDLISLQPLRDPLSGEPVTNPATGAQTLVLMAFGEYPIRMAGGDGQALTVELDNISEGVWLHFLQNHGTQPAGGYNQNDTTGKTVRFQHLENGMIRITLVFPY